MKAVEQAFTVADILIQNGALSDRTRSGKCRRKADQENSIDIVVPFCPSDGKIADAFGHMLTHSQRRVVQL